jgi:hypothetical protein
MFRMSICQNSSLMPIEVRAYGVSVTLDPALETPPSHILFRVPFDNFLAFPNAMLMLPPQSQYEPSLANDHLSVGGWPLYTVIQIY